MMGTSVCRCGAKQNKPTADQEGNAQPALLDSYAQLRTFTQLEIALKSCEDPLTAPVLIDKCLEKAR